MRSLASFKPLLAAFAFIAALVLSVTPHQVTGSVGDAVPVASVSQPDVHKPYFVNLSTIVPVVCFILPSDIDPAHLDKATPEQIKRVAIVSGTGTIFAHNRVLTAEHVIHSGQVCSIGGRIRARVAYSNLDDDVAVLDVDLGSTPVTPISCDPYEKDKPYLMFGFALGTDFALDFGEFSGVYGNVKIADPSVTGGTRNLPHAALFPGATTPGMSGGPVIDLSGRIVGINNATGADYAASRQLADTELCTAMKPAPTSAVAPAPLIPLAPAQ